MRPAAAYALSISAAIVALTFALPPLAEGHETHGLTVEIPDALTAEPPDDVVRALVGGAEQELEVAVGGGYIINPAVGPPLLTHGPDQAHGAGASRLRGFRVGDPERQPRCASDFYQHIIYAVPASKPDRYEQSVGKIRDIVRRMNHVLNRASLASDGGSADYKVLCDAAGRIQVSKLILHGGASFSNVVSEARAAGFNKANADYTIFSDEYLTPVCGVADHEEDQSLSPYNANNFGGSYALVHRICWFTEIAMHENGHNQGAVQDGAPHSTGTGDHCWDEQDVMCYSPDGGDRHQRGVVVNCRPIRFDCGYDDYFDTAPEPGEYLSDHWNLGSRFNRFISFGA